MFYLLIRKNYLKNHLHLKLTDNEIKLLVDEMHCKNTKKIFFDVNYFKNNIL